jgi:capsular polysaccharide biosynthesis protein
VSDPDQRVMWQIIGTDDDLPERMWTYDDSAGTDGRPAMDPMTGFVSLGFIRGALRRGMRLWIATALIGLVIGGALAVKFPPAYQASTSVLINDGPDADVAVTITTDAALAQSHTVAARVVQQLGLTQTVNSFLAAYTVTTVTDQLLLITVNAPTGADAVQRASAIATAFLQFRVQYAQAQQQELQTDLNQQVSTAQKNLNSIDSQISQVSAEPSSATQQAKLSSLNAQKITATNTLGELQAYVVTTLANGRTNTNAMVKGTQVVDAAVLIPHSHLKGMALYLAGGLVAGLAIGMGLVAIMALVSDRLRRRDDIADALSAPVKLSVGPLRARRWLPGLPWRAQARELDRKRVANGLGAAVPARTEGRAALAVVAVDNADVVASAVVTLAASLASHGKRVVVADLSEGAYAARLLGAGKPGLHQVSSGGADFQVATPDRGEFAPIGPLGHDGSGAGSAVGSAAGSAQPGETRAAACASADVLLTLATPDPAFGADHLATWAADAVAVVTAGRSSGTRINGVGEMVRLAGMRLVSVILIGADKTDKSLGMPASQGERTLAGQA